MRTDILNYIDTLTLGTYAKSDKLPYTTSGQSLYLTNLKTIYVDQPAYVEDPIVTSLDNVVIAGRVSSVTIYFSQDAKSLPANYETLVTALKNAKNITTLTNIHRRECDVTQTYNNDVLVTEIVIRLTTIQ